MDLKERASMADITFIYTFVERASGKVFYVGQTRHVGRRMNEHRRDLKRCQHTPLYVYMRDNNLELFRNVDVCLVGYAKTRAEAAQMEADLIERYRETVVNVVKFDSRKYSTDPRYLKVRCVDTGETWHAVAAACEHFGLTRYKLTKAIERGQPVNGHKLEFVKCRD